MELKRVSFNVAKAIKEAGYPQDNNCDTIIYDIDGVPRHRYIPGIHYKCVAPFAMEVWLWLWREKKISIELTERIKNVEANVWDNKDIHNPISVTDIDDRHNYNDPEEAIIAAIEYLVSNNLIK